MSMNIHEMLHLALTQRSGKGFPVKLRNGREILEQDFAQVASKKVRGANYTPMQLVRMRFEEGLTYDQIGKRVGISYERVRQRLSFAMRDAYRLQGNT